MFTDVKSLQQYYMGGLNTLGDMIDHIITEKFTNHSNPWILAALSFLTQRRHSEMKGVKFGPEGSAADLQLLADAYYLTRVLIEKVPPVDDRTRAERAAWVAKHGTGKEKQNVVKTDGMLRKRSFKM